MRSNVFVEVVDHERNEVIRRLGPMSRAKAEKVMGGMDINLNHERYYTRVVGDAAKTPEEATGETLA